MSRESEPTPKSSRKDIGAERRRRQARAHAKGGDKRRLLSGGGKQVWRGPKCVPEAAGWTNGFRFPDERATPAQERALEQVVLTYLRTALIRSHHRIPAELFASVFGLGERQGYNVVKSALALRHTAESELVVTVLQGMIDGRRFAGPLGYRKTELTRWLFAHINYHQVDYTATSCNDAPAFRILKSAFKVDYLIWRQEDN